VQTADFLCRLAGKPLFSVIPPNGISGRLAEMSMQRLSPTEPPERPDKSLSPSYFRRLLRHAKHKAREHAGVKTIGSIVAGVLIAWLRGGSFSTSAAYGVVTFLLFMAAVYVFHLFLAPRDLDKEAQEKLTELQKELTKAQTEATGYIKEKQLRETHETKAHQYEVERNALQLQLKEQDAAHKSEVGGLRADIDKQYREYHDKLIAHLTEVSRLKSQVFLERSKNATPQIYGKIRELFPKYSSDGLFVTLRALIGNTGAATTIQPFTLKCSTSGRKHQGRLEEGTTEYCIHRRIEKPLWPSLTKEEEYEPLTDLSADNVKPLQRHDFREGWLQFRFPSITYERPNTKFILEIRDAADTVYPIEIEPPFPLSGRIRLTKNLQGEWDEAIERSKESDQESGQKSGEAK